MPIYWDYHWASSTGGWGRCRYVITFLYVQFWIRLAVVSYRGKEVRAVASHAVRSVNMSRDTWHTELRPKRARVCNRSHLHHPFILPSPMINFINFVWSDKANTPQLQSSWRWPLWRCRSLRDVSAGHGRFHGDNPWKFRNDVIG